MRLKVLEKPESAPWAENLFQSSCSTSEIKILKVDIELKYRVTGNM